MLELRDVTKRYGALTALGHVSFSVGPGEVLGYLGPNGSGKSNIAEAFRFVLGEQSMKSMRGKRGEDLIWNGSGSSPRGGRAGVKLVFDNADRALNLDFDEVSIERVVHRGGSNDYLLNGSQVRLRDVQALRNLVHLPPQEQAP